MFSDKFAQTPEPPYYAVIFTAQRTEGDNGYGRMAEEMEKLARQQPGFLGVESVEGNEGFEITISYWATENDVKNWKANLKHQAAQRQGRKLWYDHYEIRVAHVERAYNTMTSKFDS